MSQDPSVAFPQSSSTGGMKLEAVMEQLQRQQQARLEMERKERKLREAHIMYAQQVAAQQAILAAARASGANFMGKGLAVGVPGGGLPPRVSNQSSVDSEREDDEDRGRDSGDEDDDNEMMEGDEGSDDEDEGSASGLEFLRKQTLALQQSASRIPARPFGSYSASAPQRAASPPIRVKQEPDEGLSPAGPRSATSPNGQADWGFDDHFRQVSVLPWLLATPFFPYIFNSLMSSEHYPSKQSWLLVMCNNAGLHYLECFLDIIVKGFALPILTCLKMFPNFPFLNRATEQIQSCIIKTLFIETQRSKGPLPLSAFWFLSPAPCCEQLLDLDCGANLSSSIFVWRIKSLWMVDRRLAFVAKNPPK